MNIRTLVSGTVISLILIFLPGLLSAQAPGIPKGWSDGFVYANGIRIHYYHATPNPGKPVIVMAHGVSDNGLCWTTLTQKLQSDYDIYMVDARGHGLTDPPTPADSSNAMVKDLVGFVDKMKLVKPILMGHSMGAATVMRLGAEYPQLAKAIIMLDPGLRPRTAAPASATQPRPNPAPAQASSSPSGSGKNLTVSMSGTPEALVAQNNYSYDDLVSIGRRQNPMWHDLDVQYWALSKKQYHGNYGGGIRRGPMNTDNPLEKIQVPAIILKADASPEVRKANEEAAKVMQKGKLVHIDGAAHNLHHDKLERTTQVLQEFLSGL